MPADIPHRVLGRTGQSVSVIGFGAFKIGRNEGIKYPQGYALPDDAAVDRLLNGVLDLGINLIDTAPAYGTSEQRIGNAIAHRRSEYFLSTKVGETFESGRSIYDYSDDAVIASVERSLQRLRTDLLDLVFIHSNGNDLEILSDTDIVWTLQKLRQQGKIRWLGMSGKTVEGAQTALRWADAIMVEYHLLDRSHEPVIAEAETHGVGVIVKKGLASGALEPREAIPFVLDNPAVTSLVVGGLNLDHLRDNARLASA